MVGVVSTVPWDMNISVFSEIKMWPFCIFSAVNLAHEGFITPSSDPFNHCPTIWLKFNLIQILFNFCQGTITANNHQRNKTDHYTVIMKAKRFFRSEELRKPPPHTEWDTRSFLESQCWCTVPPSRYTQRTWSESLYQWWRSRHNWWGRKWKENN